MRATIFAAAGFMAAFMAIFLWFRSDMAAARERLEARSVLIDTPGGRLEFAVSGSGPPMLMIHGTGGGFDQGLLFSEKISRAGVQIVAPSRFGYLRSSYPDNHSSEAQADEFAILLDRLKLEKVAVAGGSAGALSAVQFALRHPDRTSALILIVPAANVEGHDPNAMTPLQQWSVRRLVTSDFIYWAARKLAASQLVGFLLATDPELLPTVSPEERTRVDRILDQMLPISARSRGMLNDAELAGHPARFDFRRLKAPLMIITAQDDRFGTAETSRAIARQRPGTELIMFPTGGHILLGRDEESATAIAGFVRAHSQGRPALASNR